MLALIYKFQRSLHEFNRNNHKNNSNTRKPSHNAHRCKMSVIDWFKQIMEKMKCKHFLTPMQRQIPGGAQDIMHRHHLKGLESGISLHVLPSCIAVLHAYTILNSSPGKNHRKWKPRLTRLLTCQWRDRERGERSPFYVEGEKKWARNGIEKTSKTEGAEAMRIAE